MWPWAIFDNTDATGSSAWDDKGAVQLGVRALKKEFPDLVATSAMYRDRPFELVTVSENQPEEKDAVLTFLKRQQSTGRNLLFATPDTYGLQNAFDKDMPAALPFTLLLAPNGDVLYQELGSLDILKLRRAILANLPDEAANPGGRAYWSGE